MSPLLPASFWDRPDSLNTVMIRYTRTIYTRSISMCGFPDFIKIFPSGSPAPVVYEIFDTPGQLLKVYFDIDVKYTGIPSEEESQGVLERALSFLREKLNYNDFVVSQAHRNGKISFHIVCPRMVSKEMRGMKAVAMMGHSKNLGFDGSVYSRRQLMRPACAMGEKTDSVPLHPVPGYVGTFADHIVQVVYPDCRLLPEDFNTMQVAQVPYICTQGNIIEELIAGIDFNLLPRYSRKQMISIMKATNLQDLFNHKMQYVDRLAGPSGGFFAESAWNGAHPSTFDVNSQIALSYRSLFTQSSRHKVDEILKKYGLKHEGGTIVKIVEEVPILLPMPVFTYSFIPPVPASDLEPQAPPQVEAPTPLRLTAEDRQFLVSVLDGQVKYLARLSKIITEGAQ